MPSPTLTRRALIAGAGTAAASTALAIPYVNAAHSNEVCSLSVVDGELVALFHRWRATYVEANRDMDDAKVAQLWAIEALLIPIRPTTVEGFAMKLLVMTAYNEFDLDSDRGESVFTDAIAITGLPAPWLTAA